MRQFVDAGFTDVALIQIGGDSHSEFLRFAEAELLPALREEYGKSGDARIAVALSDPGHNAVMTEDPAGTAPRR